MNYATITYYFSDLWEYIRRMNKKICTMIASYRMIWKVAQAVFQLSE